MTPVPTAPPHVSVVMCTRNRPEMIREAVQSVLACAYPRFDLTVVDQSTSAATRDLLAPLAADPRLRYRHVDLAGLSRAYNTGIQASEGPILAFTDDDCLVPAGWLGAIVDAFAADESAGLLYGQVLLPPPEVRPAGQIPALRIRRAQRLSRRDGFRVFGMGANFAARRSLFAAIGGFDEALGGGAPLASSQDFDFAYRAYCAGFAILLRPEVWVVHYGVRSPEAWPATLRAYGIGDGAFYFKHVRCRDPFAALLLARQFVGRGGRELIKRALHLGPTDLTYVRSMLTGVRRSLQFGVDRRSRLYVPR